MSNIINTTPNEDGRIIIKLYGEKIEIDDSMFDKKGVAIIRKFGKEYEVHRPIAASQTTKRATKKTSEKSSEPVEKAEADTEAEAKEGEE